MNRRAILYFVNRTSSIMPRHWYYSILLLLQVFLPDISFAQKTSILCQKLPETSVNKRLIPQVVGSSDSIAANYAEACEAESASDFIHKIGIVRKEARETRVHLRIIYSANINFRTEIALLGKESVELIKIFSTIHRNFKDKNKVPVTSVKSVTSVVT